MPATTTSKNPIDQATIERYRELGDDFLAALVEQFSADTPGRLTTLREAHAVDDVTMLRKAAHALKGSASTIGALGMAEMCLQLERDTLTVADRASVLAHLLQEFACVTQALAAAVGSENGH